MRHVGSTFCIAWLVLSASKPAMATTLDGWSGLVAESSVDILEDRIETSIFESTFATGLIADPGTYDRFADVADHDFPAMIDIDWDDELLVYVVLRENTNWLSLNSWQPPVDGIGSLRFDWSLIEPYYHDAFSSLFHTVSRQDLTSVAVVLEHETGDIVLANLNLATNSAVVLGDMDIDGDLDFDDIDEFVLALNDPSRYEAAFGVSPAFNGDVDGDSDHDFDDIDPFVMKLTTPAVNHAQTLPEPSTWMLAIIGLLGLAEHLRRRAV